MKSLRSLATLLLLSSFGLTACVADDSGDLSKEEAANLQGKADFVGDVCEDYGWYDDQVCDVFCALPDPDCGDNSCPNPADPEVHYISEDPAECTVILFACEDGQTGFSDDCGCGCLGPEPEPEPEPNPFCGGFGNIQCEAGLTCVDDPTDDCDLGDGADCGGICVEEEPEQCPNPDDPEVHYISENVLECAAILFACEPWQTGFTDDCGCGCIGPVDAPFCGGFGNIPCEAGSTCVDDPTDDCDLGDGADCGGMCVLD